VQWSANAEQEAATLLLPSDLRMLIDEVLAQDPRPAYRAQQEDAQEYGVWLEEINVRFCVQQQTLVVLTLEKKLPG
jgi:hypothetical protein